MRTTLRRTLTAAPLFAVAAASVAGLAGGVVSAAPAPAAPLTSAGAVISGGTESEALPSPVTPGVETEVLKNGTNQPLIGEWHARQGSNTADIDFGTPLDPGQQRSRGLTVPPVTLFAGDVLTWGRVCYNHSWWNLRAQDARPSVGNPNGRREVQVSAGTRLVDGRSETFLTAQIDVWSATTVATMIETENGTAC
ncbi:hypothetical protein R3Q06_34830 [Rhodococcus erythropolis]|uniref:hypothetical protein n=1 Tax=Rhodococcus erythropolis TaxID=1833 RepID=UPI002948EA74|nr:hypothetical protein [Rhodococcus erythropolis]MDV6278572.1 hypothetical protein [Rhodococcus erythropolis]